MKSVTLLQPKKVVFGSGCIEQAAADLIHSGAKRIFIVTSPPLLDLLKPTISSLRDHRITVEINSQVDKEPTVEMFHNICGLARKMGPDVVLGVGGGSPLDAAKLVAALQNSAQGLDEVLGINLLTSRKTRLICIPTTSGTGSEVSPNALLLDEESQNKKAVVSPNLVPDAAYVDPAMTITVPPDITAITGVDALIHSIESYANRNAHPIVDLYALQSIRLIGENLPAAVRNGEDLEAREKMALGSLYGGLCLGPVNTAAVHALAYPLSGEFHIPHGLSTAVLLPHVMEFNLEAMPDRYANVAEALGVSRSSSESNTARAGLEKVRGLLEDCGVEPSLTSIGISEEAIPKMAAIAITITRLLKNNPREIDLEDAEAIYRNAL